MTVNSELGIHFRGAGTNGRFEFIDSPGWAKAVVSKLNTLWSFQGNSNLCGA